MRSPERRDTNGHPELGQALEQEGSGLGNQHTNGTKIRVKPVLG